MEQKIAQLAGIIVFVLSVLNYVLGINLISMNTVFSSLIFLNLILLVMHISKHGFSKFNNKEVE
ncbi:hypothetical protein KO527_21785 [Pseudoalteromonas sp. C2R02]|uniref:hypothetical protein n=1 Tax=Pseudoalteromonas sp. C2R02 TaxID=2841565 RepID=UPI001C09DB28|nr:hypothetical protein [Pseudoalteromonas sp. C2R02]MBU2971973.1 hypothetical protein [Pseudoalteromonas sp. C2R02]